MENFFQANALKVNLYQLPAAGPSLSEIRELAFNFFGKSLCLLLLLVSVPVLLLCALAVKLTSRGPLLYTQKRVGRNGQNFIIYKFRSMVHHAERLTGPILSTPKDSRVTRVGLVLRNLHLDELPQLINIFKGEMSFIGPRPERPEFSNEYSREVLHWDLRHRVVPGVTGLAQVCCGYDTTPDDKLHYDLLYIRHRASLRLNLFILYSTVKKVLFVRFNE